MTGQTKMTAAQREALKAMQLLEREYGRGFIDRTLHAVHFVHRDLGRFVRGLDRELTHAGRAALQGEER